MKQLRPAIHRMKKVLTGLSIKRKTPLDHQNLAQFSGKTENMSYRREPEYWNCHKVFEESADLTDKSTDHRILDTCFDIYIWKIWKIPINYGNDGNFEPKNNFCFAYLLFRYISQKFHITNELCIIIHHLIQRSRSDHLNFLVELLIIPFLLNQGRILNKVLSL